MVDFKALKEFGESFGYLVLGVGWVIKKLIEYFNRKKSKIPLTDSNNELDKEIYPVLHTLRNRYRASRVYIQQFHNGTRAYSGQSLQRKTITHEVNDDGVEKIKPYFDGRLISESTHRVLAILRTFGEYYVDDIENLNPPDKEKPGRDKELYQWCIDNKIKSLYYVRVADIREDVTVATLNLHFPIKDGLFDTSFRSDVKKHRRLLESIFDKIKT